MILAQEYIVQKFYTYAGSPKHRRYGNVYYASCPICREGKNWLRKRRLYYIPEKNLIYCQNEQRGWSPLEWIREVSGMDYAEIFREAESFEMTADEVISRYQPEEKKERYVPTLPFDSINLTDAVQLTYYRENRVVNDCVSYIKERRLDTAVNRPEDFFVSLIDRIHRNRLCIPFQNRTGKIVFYQTRLIYPPRGDEYEPKYLSKLDAEKTVFGIDRIDENFGYIFLFEGPIDAMFVRNGIAMAGITTSEEQEKQLMRFQYHDRIWVLDNPFLDQEADKKIHTLIDRGERVFVYPKKIRAYKDINEMCVAAGLDELPPALFIEHSNSKIGAEILLSC